MKDRCELLCVDAAKAEAIRKALIPTDGAQEAANRVLFDPTRFTPAAALREGGELCVCDLSWISQRKQALTSHHLRSLRSEGLVRSRRDGKLVMCSLTEEGLTLLSTVLDVKTEVISS